MSFWQRVKGLFSSGTSAAGHAMLSGVFPSGLPPRRGTKELLDAYSTHPWMHATVHRIGENVASARWRLYSAGRGTQVRRRIDRDASGSYRVENASEVTSHPMLDLLRRPNPAMMRIPFWGSVSGYLDTKGEVPIIKERAQDGKPLELWPVPPHWLRETPSAGRPFYTFQWMGWTRQVPEADVLYLAHPELTNPYGRGRGTGEALADELDIDEFAAKHIAAFFYNRGLPDVFISLKGIKDQKTAEQWEERIRNKYRGSQRAWQAHITNYEMQFHPVTQNFRDAQLRELRTIQRDTFLQVFGVPPEVMGIVDNSNRATIGAADYLFTSKVICPRLDFLADGLTEIAREWDDRLFVAYESPVEEDAEFRLRVMQVQPALFTKNEWRELAQQPPRDGWDEEFAGPSSSSGDAGKVPLVEDPEPAELPEGDDDPDEQKVLRLPAGR